MNSILWYIIQRTLYSLVFINFFILPNNCHDTAVFLWSWATVQFFLPISLFFLSYIVSIFILFFVFFCLLRLWIILLSHSCLGRLFLDHCDIALTLPLVNIFIYPFLSYLRLNPYSCLILLNSFIYTIFWPKIAT